jgi:uncharacterized protein
MVIPEDRLAGTDLLVRAAEMGHAPAQCFLAEQSFTRTPPVNHGRAMNYLQSAAKQEWPRALAVLGFMHLEGKVVPLDRARGYQLLMKAAYGNEPQAQYFCATEFSREHPIFTNLLDGVPLRRTAKQFLRSAAEQGFPSAQNDYAQLISRPDAPDRSPVEALKWFEIAAARQQPGAITNLAALMKEMTPEQILQARREAAVFEPKWRGRSPYFTRPGLPPALPPPLERISIGGL